MEKFKPTLACGWLLVFSPPKPTVKHGNLKVVDLFAGVGGFSLGAIRAGFDVVAAIDLDSQAAVTHQRNFPRTAHARRNILGLTGDQIRELSGIGTERLTGVIGGPPCQGFSRMGKMRKNDARNKLFYHFFRLVKELRPLFFVCENVPGILDEKYTGLRENANALIARDYHLLQPLSLSAGEYGAATDRSRVFFVGFARDAGFSLCQNHFVVQKRRCKTTVSMALAGLPTFVDPGWQTEVSSWRKVLSLEDSFLKNLNQHPNGTGDSVAVRRFKERSEVSGFFGTNHSRDVVARFARVEQGKSDPVSKFPRLKWDALCPTLRAGTSRDRGSYQAARPIHPSEHRVITPREAARLQGFPDWFQFHASKWHSFRQIGNSVSPLVSEGVLAAVCKQISA